MVLLFIMALQIVVCALVIYGLLMDLHIHEIHPLQPLRKFIERHHHPKP